MYLMGFVLRFLVRPSLTILNLAVCWVVVMQTGNYGDHLLAIFDIATEAFQDNFLGLVRAVCQCKPEYRRLHRERDH